jgi:hypothetical protein
MQASLQPSLLTKTHVAPEVCILWHVRTMPVPGVVLAVDDETERATIRVRNLGGQLQEVVVSYGEIEVRSC